MGEEDEEQYSLTFLTALPHSSGENIVGWLKAQRGQNVGLFKHFQVVVYFNDPTMKTMSFGHKLYRENISCLITCSFFGQNTLKIRQWILMSYFNQFFFFIKSSFKPFFGYLARSINILRVMQRMKC